MPNVKNIKCKMQNFKKRWIQVLKVNTGVTYKLSDQGRCLELLGPLGFGYVDLVKGKIFYKDGAPKLRKIQNNIIRGSFCIESQGDASIISVCCRAWNLLFIKTLVKNLFFGVSIGFTKHIDLRGVGYRAELNDNFLFFKLGYTHLIKFKIPKRINILLISKTSLEVQGVDPQLVSQVACNIWSFQPPEPYNGKGVFIDNEIIARKEGKKQ